MKRYDSGMFKKGNIYIYFVHTMKAGRRSRVWLHSFLTSALDGVQWVT
jgi:hypothetical protein